MDIFFDQMEQTDFFGFLSIGEGASGDEIILEEKERNPKIKKLFLKSLMDEEPFLKF